MNIMPYSGIFVKLVSSDEISREVYLDSLLLSFLHELSNNGRPFLIKQRRPNLKKISVIHLCSRSTD